MRVRSEFKDGKLLIKLEGDLDHHGARTAMGEIEELVDMYLPRDCVVDMSGITFMDSSGIAIVLKTYRRVREIDGKMCVEKVPPQPMRVFDASGIDRIVDIYAQESRKNRMETY